jgi:uncharacterized protein YeaO (DUF488 family)
MTIRSVQLGTARIRDEGLRVGTVRFLPRGVRKDQYAELDYFDVWLPILAPSRDLMKRLKTTNITFDTFARRYRNEMKKTDARQVLQMVAQMAGQTNLSVGCYCADERRCHRSILMNLIQEVAGQPVVLRPTHSQFCVYTIVHPDDLKTAFEEDVPYTYSENKRWSTALKLMEDAQSAGQIMPIIFGDATDCSRLLYSGILSDVEITGDGTSFTFRELRRIKGRHSPQELRLRSTGRLIAPGFIRPYAICHTPDFIPNPQ